MLSRVPTESFLVRKVWGEVESAWTDDFANHVTKEKLDFLRLKVAPLLRLRPTWTWRPRASLARSNA